MSDSALTPELIHATSLAAIVQSSEDAIISKNLDGVIQTWNSAAEHMFGYSAAEAIGQPIRLIIPDDRLEEERGILRQLRDGNRIEHFETIRITKDGRRLHISLTVSPIRDRNGRVVGASKIARDISQQKRDHEALEETQKRLAVTLQSIGDAVLATDREGRVTFLNTVAETLMRAGQQDIVGRSIVDVFNIQDETTGLALESPVEQVLRERRAVGMAHSTMLRRTDGTSIPIDDCAAPILGEQGELIGVVMVFRDVSAHRMAQRAASLLAEVVTSSNDAVVTKDLSGCVTSWNQAAEKIFGYTSAEMVGRSILAIIPTDRHAEEADILAKLARGERIDHYETVRQRKDGSLRQISVTISPLYDVDGRVVGASKIARDVTEQRRTQRALQETQERWKVTLRSIGDGVIVTDTSGRIAFANPVALELIQKTEGEVLGTPLAEVFAIAHETTKEAVENPVNRVLRDGGRVGLARHTVLLQPSGSEIPIDDSAAPIRSDDGQLLGVVLVFREIIERREAERQLTRWGQELEQRVAQRTNELVHSQKQLRALAAQLRTTEQRERRRLATDLHDYLAQLLALGRLKLTQIKHIAQVDSPRLEPMLLEAEQLLDQCLSYTRTLMAQLSPSVLHDLGLLAGLRWLAERMQEQGLMVEVRAADTQLPALEDSQADMVFQTVRELLMNVIKHAGVSRASVTVEMRSRSELRIVVQDEGRGFDVSVIDRVPAGTHFGLFSIQERMQTMSGWCRVESASGRGTRVELNVPLQSESSSVEPSTASVQLERHESGNTEGQGGERRRIILVDDHAMVRQGLRSILDTYRDLEVVAEASDGEEAVSLAARLRPAVMVMDINLPRLNGIEATRRVKARWPDTVVIGITVHRSPQTADAFLAAGGEALLSKEEAADDLYQLIMTFTRGKRPH